MLLAIDTATRWTGVALFDGLAVPAELGWRGQMTQTVELAPAIRDLLARVGLTTSDLKGVAVAMGPGSYTSLRVGMALAKGIAMAQQIPLIGVNTLDIVAAACGPLDEQLLAVVEAGRTRVCAGVYQWQKRGGWQPASQAVIAGWADVLAGLTEPTVFTGEVTAAAARQIRAVGKEFRVLAPNLRTRRAGYLAAIGWQRLKKGQVDDVASLAPDYLNEPAGS